VVLLTIPPTGVKLTLLPNPLPDVRDTSKAADIDITRFAVRSVPETIKICSADGVPTVVEKGFKPEEKEMLGVPGAVVVPLMTITL
jgi:hypothetical protein